MKITETPKVVMDSKFLFTQLTTRLANASPEARQRILHHVRVKTQHETLESYHGNGASEQDKLALYKEILRALIKPDLESLTPLPAPEAEVVVEKSDAAEAIPHAVVSETVAKAFGMRSLPAHLVTVLPDPVTPGPAPAVELPRQEFGDMKSKAETLVEVLRGLVEPADKAGIEILVRGIVTSMMDDYQRKLDTKVQEIRVELVKHIDKRFSEYKEAIAEAVTELDGSQPRR